MATTTPAGASGPAQPTAIDVAAEVTPLLDLVTRHADWANEHRRPHPEVFDALASAGLLRLIAPAGYGGRGAGPETFLSMVETLARVDGSTAWAAMTINEEVGIACSYLPPTSMTELLHTEPDVIIAGSGIAAGQARSVEGGWLVDGHWRFISGAPVADRIILGSRVTGPAPGAGEDGPARSMPSLCFTLIPAGELTIEDTWHTSGLRGTGSNDVVAREVFVPDRLAGLTDLGGSPRPDSPYYQLPSGLRFPWPKVGVAAGLARAAIDEFTGLALTKKPSHGRDLLAERPRAQAAVAEAEALVGSGRAWVLAILEELWVAAADGRIDPKLHARARLAASHAVDSAIRAVDGLASAAGTSASRLDGPWPRLQADVRSVGQHFMVGPQQMQTAGRVLLDLPAGDPAF